MNIFKVALRHIQAVLPKRWQKPKAVTPSSAAVDRYEPAQTQGRRPRAPTIDWADIDRRLPQGDPLLVMDQVLGSSARYTVVRGVGFYCSEAESSASPSLVSLAPTEAEIKHT